MRLTSSLRPLWGLLHLLRLVAVASGPGQAVGASLRLQCPACDQIHCSPRKARRLRCRGSVTRGVCHCCPVCAKTEGEACGGVYNYLGRCDRGLHCRAGDNDVLPAPSRMGPRIGPRQLHPPGVDTPEGVCNTVPSAHVDRLADQPASAHCRPKCSRKFCRQRPRAICSAVDSATTRRSCQGACQHTSCRACRLVPPDNGCDKCRPDDFRCLRHFGRCTKRNYCTRRKFPCKQNMPYIPGSRFECLVPQCLDDGT